MAKEAEPLIRRDDPAPVQEYLLETVKFVWNSRTCRGHPIHQAALEGDVPHLQRVLAKEPQSCSLRFVYDTEFFGQKMEGSGEAVHLAASRGFTAAIQVLLAARASPDAMVTRDHKPHYNALHAAIFAEGRGGTTEMIECLLAARADAGRNMDGKLPIHIAFQTGNVPLIRILRRHMKILGQASDEFQERWTLPEQNISRNITPPLELGVLGGKMTVRAIVTSAALHPQSLRILMRGRPDALGLFLNRCNKHGRVEEILHAANVTGLDVAQLARQSVSSVLVLLDAATRPPAIENEGWHPLPTQVSFAARNMWDFAWNTVNQGSSQRTLLTFLNPDKHWKFDSVQFHCPEWHITLTNRAFGEILQADTAVCIIPDLVTPDVFTCLASAGIDVKILEHRVFGAMVEHVFENFVAKVEIVRSFVNVWIVALLSLSTWALRSSTQSLQQSESKPTVVLVAVQFVAAQGFADIMLEFMQVFGLFKMGRPRDYLQFDNLVDLLSAILPAYLWIDPESRPVTVFAIFVYWSRVLGIASLREALGHELEPFRNLLRGLIPALVITGIAFGAFSHAFFFLGADSLDKSIYSSFITLITAGMPDEPEGDMLDVGLLYMSVTFFSVFILNIFIGVLGEQYSIQKEHCVALFRRRRAELCLRYMQRMHCLQQFRVCSGALGHIVLAGSILACLTLQGLTARGVAVLNDSWEFPVYLSVLLCMYYIAHSSFNSEVLLDPSVRADSQKLYYFWCCYPVSFDVGVDDGDVSDVEAEDE
ncbi:unnamed protein product [Symbiodinium sp. CCMP2592]|nr:unnamed protein product [Symbiodinium sp. CCMP2592]